MGAIIEALLKVQIHFLIYHMYRSAPDDRGVLMVKSSQNPVSYTTLRPSMTSSRTNEWFMSNKSNLIQNVFTLVEKSSYNNH